MKVFISKANQSVDVDFETLPDNSKEYIIAYGLKQCLNDCHSQISSKEDDAAEKAMGQVEMKLNALQTGELRRVGTSRRVTDPVQREFERLAWELLKSGTGATKKAIVEKYPDHSIDDLINAFAAKTEGDADKFIADLRKTATKTLEKSKATNDVDLSDLV